LVLEAGAVEECKRLVLKVPLSVQSEMTAAIAVLALSDELKPRLLNLGVFDVLIPLTESESIEVQGNSAAALGNLSSKGNAFNHSRLETKAITNSLTVGDYSLFLDSWNQPSDGIHGYLSRFLASQDATFQHIAIWTLLQLLESGDQSLLDTINKADDVMQMVQEISEKTVESEDEGEGSEDGGEGEVVALAKRCLELASGEPIDGSDSGSTSGYRA
jgi:vacuolar protein 8